MNDLPEPQHTELHGHRVSYRSAGEGPVVVRLHGVTSTSKTWHVSILSDFIESTEAAELNVDNVRERLKAGGADSPEGG